MVLYFVALSSIAVWVVFRDPRVDFRFVAAGSLVPLLVDAPVGERAVGHTLLLAAGALALAVVVTAGRRPARARLVMLPVGMLVHLLLDGVFGDPETLWWPFLGTGFPGEGLVPSPGAVALREGAGLAGAWWFARRFGLGDAARRRRFLRAGRVEVAA